MASGDLCKRRGGPAWIWCSLAAMAGWWRTGALALALVGCGGSLVPPLAPPVGASGVLPPGMRPAKADGHLAATKCLSFSPDGREILSGSEDRTLLVWEVESGRMLQRLEGHAGYVGPNACAFLPDGRRIVSAGWGGEVFVWDRATGKRVKQLAGLSSADSVSSLSVRPDGREVMVGGRNGRVTAWDLASGEITFDNRDLRHPPEEGVWAVGYLDDGRRFGGGGAGKLLVWDNGKPRQVPLQPTSALPLSGGRLLLGTAGALHLIEADGQPRKLADYDQWIYALALSPRRDVAVAGDMAGNTRVWNLATGTRRCELPRSAGVWAAAFDPGGTRFAVAGNDATVILARASDCSIERRLQATRSRVSSVAAGSSVLLGDGAGNASEWVTGDLRMSHIVAAHAGEVMALAALPEGRWVSGGADTYLVAGDRESKRKIGSLRNLPWRILPLPGEASVLAIDMSGYVNLVPLDGRQPRQIFSAGGAPLYAAAIRPGKPEVVLGGRVPGLHKLALPQGTEMAVWPDAGQTVSALAYSPDGARLVEGSTDGDVVLRDPDSGTIDRRLTGLHKQVLGLVFTPAHLWAGGDDNKLLRWALAGGTTADREIPETSPIHNLTATPDGRYLIAALDDGAMVHALPEGEPVARLIPFKDRSWATLHADGRYVASSGDALTFRVENRETRQVITLGNPSEPASIGTPSVRRLATGHARVRTTVFSPSGPPRVRLDDRWDLVSVLPSEGNLAAYEVDVILDDSSARAHTLTVIPPEGSPRSRSFAPPSVIQSARALVIGNEGYRDPGVPRLPGARADAEAISRVLQAEQTWHLPSSRVRHLPDLDAVSLEREARAFFDSASPDETLLFYFAGHGDREGNEGYLLPTDYQPGSKARRLSASTLWSLIERSKAERVVVILDACRSGSFAFPEAAASRGDTSTKAVAFLTSTSAATSAVGTAQGGEFTQGLVRALGRVESIDASAGAVTVLSAYLHAAGEAAQQRPRLTGSLDALPLAWPRDPDARAVRAALRTTGVTAESGIAAINATLETRQLVAKGAVKGDPRGERRIEVLATLGKDAEWIRVAVYFLTEKKRAELEILAPSLDGPRFKRGRVVPFSLPVHAGMAPGTHRVEVQICDAGAVCGKQAPATFEVEL